ncbi:MAG: hypothetical protein ACOYOF_08270 [Verrucomicrobiaceae bacterium]
MALQSPTMMGRSYKIYYISNAMNQRHQANPQNVPPHLPSAFRWEVWVKSIGILGTFAALYGCAPIVELEIVNATNASIVVQSLDRVGEGHPVEIPATASARVPTPAVLTIASDTGRSNYVFRYAIPPGWKRSELPNREIYTLVYLKDGALYLATPGSKIPAKMQPSGFPVTPTR